MNLADRPAPADPGARSRCSASRPATPERLFRDGRLLHAVRRLPARHRPAATSSTSSCACTGSTRPAAERARGRRSSGSAWSTPPARRIAGYSKGMRQRIKLAQAIAHDPRCCSSTSRSTASTRWPAPRCSSCCASFAADGRHVVVSSHILHEVDLLSDRVVLVHGGYVVAEGEIAGDARRDGRRAADRRCWCAATGRARSRRASSPRTTSSRRSSTPDGRGLLRAHARRRALLPAVNRLAAEGEVEIEQVLPVDDDVQSVYRYLISGQAQGAS